MSFLFFSGGRSTTLSSFRAFFFISGGCSATLSIPNIHYSSTKDKRKRKIHPKKKEASFLKQIQRAIEVDFFADLELEFGLSHVVEQKFQDEGAAEAAAFDFEVRKACGGVGILNVLDSDKAGIFHGVGEAVAAPCVRRGTNVVFLSFAKVLLAHVLVALFAVLAAEPAAFIAQEFDFLLLRSRQCIQLGKLLIQPEIRHHVTEIVTIQFVFKLF